MATASSQAGSASVQSIQTSSSNTEESSIYTSCSSDGSDADEPGTLAHTMFPGRMPPKKEVRPQ